MLCAIIQSRYPKRSFEIDKRRGKFASTTITFKSFYLGKIEKRFVAYATSSGRNNLIIVRQIPRRIQGICDWYHEINYDFNVFRSFHPRNHYPKGLLHFIKNHRREEVALLRYGHQSVNPEHFWPQPPSLKTEDSMMPPVDKFPVLSKLVDSEGAIFLVLNFLQVINII